MPTDRKINIELTPYDALCLISFITEMTEDIPAGNEIKLEALLIAKQNFFNEVAAKTTPQDIEDCYAQREVNVLLGKEPDAEN